MVDDKNKGKGVTPPAKVETAKPASTTTVVAQPVIATVPPVAAPVTEASLMAQLTEALGKKDFKQVAKVSSEIAKFNKDKEAIELKAKQETLAAITGDIAAAIKKALQPVVDSGKLDQADGIWYAWDFGDKLQTCRLMKTAAKASSAGGTRTGVGKKYDISTSELLTKFGNQEYKDGMTFAEAQEKSTDKNWRYAIREKLLKLNGTIQ